MWSVITAVRDHYIVVSPFVLFFVIVSVTVSAYRKNVRTGAYANRGKPEQQPSAVTEDSEACSDPDVLAQGGRDS